MDAAQRALCIVAKYKRGNLRGQSSAGGVAVSARQGKGRKDGRNRMASVSLYCYEELFSKKKMIDDLKGRYVTVDFI